MQIASKSCVCADYAVLQQVVAILLSVEDNGCHMLIYMFVCFFSLKKYLYTIILNTFLLLYNNVYHHFITNNSMFNNIL